MFCHHWLVLVVDFRTGLSSVNYIEMCKNKSFLQVIFYIYQKVLTYNDMYLLSDDKWFTDKSSRLFDFGDWL